MNRLTWNGTAEPYSRDQFFWRERGQGKFISPVQLTTRRISNPVDPYSAIICDDHTILGVFFCTQNDVK